MAGKKILVVDDDAHLLRMVQVTLKRDGYRAIVVARGQEAIDRVRAEAPDLILMDIMMPGLDGFETTRYIRQLPKGRDVPIIFLSARQDVQSKITGLRLGADDYIAKPVTVGELLARIEARLRESAAAPGRVINLFGSKPGVGTTTLAVNLALALRRISRGRIVLIDWQRPLGDVAALLDLVGMGRLESLLPGLEGLTMQELARTLHPYAPDVQVLLGATEPSSARWMTRQALDHVSRVAAAQADYVLVDCGDFFSWRVPPLVARSEGLNLCVLTPDSPAVSRANRAKVSVEKNGQGLWFLLNRDGIPGGVSLASVKPYLGVALKASLPEDSARVGRAGNEGQPVFESHPEVAFSRHLQQIALAIHQKLSSSPAQALQSG